MDQMNENVGAVSTATTHVARLSNRTRRRREGPDLTKCVIYARFSTTEQTEVSIERQVEVCREYARAKGLTVAAVYVDRAKSGALVTRAGLENMVRGAKAGEFGVLLIENSDRLARDLGILSTTYKLLSNVGVEMHQPGRGRLSLTDIAFQGLMGDEQRRIMSERSQYSRNVMAREGRVPAGASLGYDPVPGQPGVLVVNESEAAVVRRMFDMRLQGLGIRSICTILSSEGFTYPRSGKLSYSGVAATLANERYAGLVVYGRHHTAKDRETGRESVTVRDADQWITADAPHLRIVDQEVWDKVQAISERNRARRRHLPERANAEGSAFMLTGLIPCPCCPRTLSVGAGRYDQVRYSCAGNRRHGTCGFNGSVNVQKLERVVLGLIRGRLDEPGFVDAYLDAYNGEHARAAVEHADERSALERKVARLNEKLVATFEEAFTKGFSAHRLTNVRVSVEKDLTEAERDLAALPRRPVPATIDRGKVRSLRDTVERISALAPFRPVDKAGKVVVASIREMIERVEIDVTGHGVFDVGVSLRIAPFVAEAGMETPSLGNVVLRGSYEKPDGRYNASARSAPDRAMHARGDFRLSEGDAAAVEAFLSGQRFHGRLRGADVRRDLVEAMNFVARTGAPWLALPGTPRPRTLYTLALIFSDRGLWDGIARLLEARDPVRYGHLPGSPYLPKRRIFRNRPPK